MENKNNSRTSTTSFYDFSSDQMEFMFRLWKNHTYFTLHILERTLAYYLKTDAVSPVPPMEEGAEPFCYDFCFLESGLLLLKKKNAHKKGDIFVSIFLFFFFIKTEAKNPRTIYSKNR